MHKVHAGMFNVALRGGGQDVRVAQLGLHVLSTPPVEGIDSGSLELTVSIDGEVTILMCTGRFFEDIDSLWLADPGPQQIVVKEDPAPASPRLPQHEDLAAATPAVTAKASEPGAAIAVMDGAQSNDAHVKNSTQGESEPPKLEKPTPFALKWRVLLSMANISLHPGSVDTRSISLQLLNFSIFSWPAAYIKAPDTCRDSCGIFRSRMDISAEALSVRATGSGITAGPLLSPLSVNGSIISLTPERKCSAQAGTEVDFCMAPALVSIGAWQLRLLVDVLSFYDTDASKDDAASHKKHEDGTAHDIDKGEAEVSNDNEHSQLDLLEDILHASDMDEADIKRSDAEQQQHPQQQPQLPQPQHVAPSIMQRLAMELDVDVQGSLFLGGGKERELEPELPSEPTKPDVESQLPMPRIRLPVMCRVNLDELEPWQAVQLPDVEGDGCPRFALRLDRPVRVVSISVRAAGAADLIGATPDGVSPAAAATDSSPTRAHGTAYVPLMEGVGFTLGAWNDATSQFVDVTCGEAAMFSHLVALRLAALAGVRRFSLEVVVESLSQLPYQQQVAKDDAASASGVPQGGAFSSLVVRVSTPRLTFSVMHSSVCCASAPLVAAAPSIPAAEEPFGDITLFSFQFGMWTSQEGMAISFSSSRVAIDLYDMSTFSLAPIMLPEENEFGMVLAMASVAQPCCIPLASAQQRNGQGTLGTPIINISLGAWRMTLPPWACARLVHLGESVAGAFSFDPCQTPASSESMQPPRRLPLIVQNALPVTLVFGQACTTEKLSLLPGEQRAYAWRRAKQCTKTLTFALSVEAARSNPLQLCALAMSDDVMWSVLELMPREQGSQSHCPETPYRVHVCVKRVSVAQHIVMVLPSVFIFSHLSFPVELAAMQDSRHVLCSTNRVLSSARYLHSIPVATSLRENVGSSISSQATTFDSGAAASEPSPAGDVTEVELCPSTMFGLLVRSGISACVRFRQSSQPWSVELPVSVDQLEPYTTLIPLGSDSRGCALGATCVYQGLWAGPRVPDGSQDPPAEERLGKLSKPELATLPNVFHLRPLLAVENKAAHPVTFSAHPLGSAVICPGGRHLFEVSADPRQLTQVELCIKAPRHVAQTAAGDELHYSTGTLLLGGLTQFPSSEVDELVSWRNSVRCVARGDAGDASQEVLLLVEVRRCVLSGLPRSIVVYPMWHFHNHTGEDILLRFVGEESAQILHIAPPGESSSMSLGQMQLDPSSPFEAVFGVRAPDGSGVAVWTKGPPQRCPMGQTSLLLIEHEGICFTALVCVQRFLDAKKAAGGPSQSLANGGVLVSFYAAGYVRSEATEHLMLSLSSDGPRPLQVPPCLGSGKASPLPWAWWPSSASAIMGDLRKPLADDATAKEGAHPKKESPPKNAQRAFGLGIGFGKKACTETGLTTTVQLKLGSEGARRPGVNVIPKLVDLLAPAVDSDQVAGGSLRDVAVPTPGCQQPDILLNINYQVHAQGCLSLSIMPSEQPPLVCANFSQCTAWLGNPWTEPALAPASWHRLAPGGTAQFPCPVLRSLEVFPPGGPATSADGAPGSPRRIAVDIYSSLSVDPEDASGGAHVEFVLTKDLDMQWEPLGMQMLSISVRYVSAVCRVEIRPASAPSSSEPSLPAPVPLRASLLPLYLDVSIHVRDLIAHLPVVDPHGHGQLQQAESSAAGAASGQPEECARSLVLHASGVAFRYAQEGELETREELGRQALSRTALVVGANYITLSDFGRPPPSPPLRHVLTIPALDLEVKMTTPPFGLPTSYERLRIVLRPAHGDTPPAVAFSLDDALLEACQTLASEFSAEFGAEYSDNAEAHPDDLQCTSSRQGEIPPMPWDEFRYLFLSELYMSALPLSIDLQLSAPVFFSFTGLTLTFPEVRLTSVATTSFTLGQELLAHCIAFLLLNSPVLLGSCDLFGNPVQAYRHLRDGVGDLLSRPIHEGFSSFARHLSSASLMSISALSDSIRRNLPAAPPGPSPVPAGEGGLGAGVRALADGVGKGLTGVVRWEQHTPQRQGAMGHLQGVRNAVVGAVAHPVGGVLDFVTTSTKGWSTQDDASCPSGPHPASCAACLGRSAPRLDPDVSPLKFHLQCCQGLPPQSCTPAVVFWSPRCELVRVSGADGTDGRCEPNLHLVRAGLLLTTAQLCVLLDEEVVHVLDIGSVQAAEETCRGRPPVLVTIAGTGGRIWQLHVPDLEPGELAEHLRRARGLLPLGAASLAAPVPSGGGSGTVVA